MILLVAVASFLASLTMVALAREFAMRSGIMDIPNTRSSHSVPTPRGGGIGIVLVSLSALAIAYPSRHGAVVTAWMVGGGLVAIAGGVDDIRGVPVIPRLGVQIVAAAVLLAAFTRLPALAAPAGTTVLWALECVLGAGAIVWSINLFNFMDGIDGLAAAQAIFIFGAAFMLVELRNNACASELPLLALAGASAGFLVWNCPPARIFMGDVGSGFIGFSIAAGACLTDGHAGISPWTWLVLNGVFVADATSTLVIRLFRRQRVHEPHRSHLYQRLGRRWKSHRAVTLLYLLVNLFWCLPWATATVYFPAYRLLLLTAALLPLFVLAAAGGAGRAGN